MNGVFSLGKVSDDSLSIIFDFTDNTPNQVVNYIHRIIEQSDELYQTTINTVIVLSKNKLELSRERLSLLKANYLKKRNKRKS